MGSSFLISVSNQACFFLSHMILQRIYNMSRIPSTRIIISGTVAGYERKILTLVYLVHVLLVLTFYTRKYV